jgi:hypothetical protein
MVPSKRKQETGLSWRQVMGTWGLSQGRILQGPRVSDIGNVSRIGTGSKQGVTARPLTNLGLQQVELQG